MSIVRMTIQSERVMLTTRELADRWGIAPGSLANDRALGRSAVPYVKIGERVRYRLADVIAFEDRSLHGTNDRR